MSNSEMESASCDSDQEIQSSENQVVVESTDEAAPPAPTAPAAPMAPMAPVAAVIEVEPVQVEEPAVAEVEPAQVEQPVEETVEETVEEPVEETVVAEVEPVQVEQPAEETAVVVEVTPEVAVEPVQVEEPAEEPEVVVEETVVAEVEPAQIKQPVEEAAVIVEKTPEVASEPVQVEQPVVAEAEPVAAETGFRVLGLNDALVSAVESFGYTTPTPIQAETIPLLLEGRDVLGQAQTGTGKTAAFALPLLQRIKLSKKKPQVLVLAPTRELAIQVAESFEKYAKSMPGLRVVPIYGGQDYQIQFRQLNRGVHIVVGTPGRVMDHMRRGSLDLSELKCLVLDEADEMLRMGFAEDVDWVLTQIPEKRQMALFSATMPKPIRQIAQTHLTDPAEITIKQKTATADTIRQRYVVAAPYQKQAILARILDAEPTDGILVFVKTRVTTDIVAEFLGQAGFRAVALNGDIQQKQRERIVERLRSGKIDVLVATDVAARGLDVQRISHVINYDLPFDSEAYVHRIGRTGRAGRSGEAILFAHPKERYLLKRLENATRQTIEEMNLPSNRDINKQRVARFHEKITQALNSKQIETFKSIIEQYQRDNDVPVEMIAASLAILANEKPLLVKEELKQVRFSDGNKRNDRNDNRSRNGKRDFQKDRNSGQRHSDANMQTYRIDVGRNHKVMPGNIVGAIANEAGLGNGAIGKIKIFDRFSTVDLPNDISKDMIDALQDVFVAGRKLKISRMNDSHAKPGRFQSSKRPFNKSKPKFRKKTSDSRS